MNDTALATAAGLCKLVKSFICKSRRRRRRRRRRRKKTWLEVDDIVGSG